MKEPTDTKSLWRIQREKKAFLALADGTVFRGWSAGFAGDAVGEAVFNTGMTGYQEILSDPSYAGQFVTLTSPEIGNYGCNSIDMESRGTFLHGFVISELNESSNFRAEENLGDFLRRRQIPALAGVDTRALTLHLRDHGSQKGFLHVEDSPISVDEAIDRARAWCGLDGQDYVKLVTTDEPFAWSESGKYHVVACDFGCKYNILRQLAAHDMRVTVVPARTSAEDILALDPDGVFLSNGPADPAAVTYAIDNIRKLLGKVPLMGICLGHQLLGLASGAKCSRLKFGHHGCNHPVKNLLTGSVEITSQNHNYALCDLPETLEVTHLNLNDNTIEGIRHKKYPAFSVQYHPEAAPGPHDASYLFKQFADIMEK